MFGAVALLCVEFGIAMFEYSRRILVQDSSSYSGSETQRVKYALYISLVFFVILLVTFEFIRHIRQIFLKRITRKFQVSCSDISRKMFVNICSLL